MFLPELNSTHMQRDPNKVFNMAYKQPVLINRMGKEGVVMLSKKEYAKLVANQK